jgi:asparagine N-glycosylation enzyme membrane subunit Stt3
MSRSFHWWAALAIAAGLALFLRAGLPFPFVFTIDGVTFQEHDAWYHMRLVEGFLAGIPAFTLNDPHGSFPSGQRVDVGPVLDILVVAAHKLTGLDPWIAAAWCPVALWLGILAVLATLALRLFSPLHAVLAVTISCLLGGNFLRVTSLGFHDHHALEILLYLLILLTLPASRFWLSALCLWLYLITFLGGALLVAFLLLWRLLTPSAPNLWRTYALTFLLLIPFYQTLWVGYSMAAVLAALALELLPRALPRPRHRHLLLGLAAIPLLWAANHFGVFDLARLFSSSSAAATINEMKHFQPLQAWRFFGFFAVFSLAGFAQFATSPAPPPRLLSITTLGLLLTSLFQIRFAYYLSVPVALYSAAWLIPWTQRLPRRLAFAAPPLLLLLSAPTLFYSYNSNSQNYGYTAEWRDLFAWFRAQTPPPVSPTEAYPRLLAYRPDYRSAPSAYGVLIWWEYGYGLITLAHRTPFTNPTHRNAALAAQILLTPSPAAFHASLREHHLPYAVLNDTLLLLPNPGGGNRGMFLDLVTWAGHDRKTYYEELSYRKPDGGITPLSIFHPSYYQTAAVRLTLFGTAPYMPHQGICTASRHADTLTHLECFNTPAAAAERLAILPNGILFGMDTIHSPVPLPAWDGLEAVYQSREKTARIDDRFVPAITVYQRRD